MAFCHQQQRQQRCQIGSDKQFHMSCLLPLQTKIRSLSQGAEIHKWAEGGIILEEIFCSVLVNDQQSLSTSLDDPCFAFCNPDQLSHRNVFTGHGLKNIPFKFKDHNDKMLRKQRCAWIYSVTETICLWMFKDQIRVHISSWMP